MMIPDKIAYFFKQFKIPREALILVAFSGGPDSTALLFSLLEVQKKYKFEFKCAYYDHGIRRKEERDAERTMVTENCKKAGVHCFIGTAQAGELALEKKKTGASLEDLARNARYNFFKKLKADFPYDFIATGHTADDQLETVMMRFFQGSGSTGLIGMRPVSDNIIRPLSGCSREEIMTYLEKNKISYSTDSSNIETDFLRNKIRHILMPAVRSIFPGVDKSLASFSEKMVFVDEYIKLEAGRQIHWQGTETGFQTDFNRFFDAPPALRLQSLYSVYERFYKTEKHASSLKKQLPFRFFKPLLQKKSGMRMKNIICEGNGLRFSAHENRLFLESCVVTPDKKDYVISVGFGLPFSFGVLAGVLGKAMPENSAYEDIIQLNEDEITLPLRMRSWQNGDRIYLGYGRKKLKKIYREWKVDARYKHMIPVLEDEQGIVAILGKIFGYRNIQRFYKKGNGITEGKIFYLALHGRDNFNTLKWK